MADIERVLVNTNTGEALQPMRLYLRVGAKHAVEDAPDDLGCMFRDADRPGTWTWMYVHEAERVTLRVRPEEVDEEVRPVVLAEMSFPRPRHMVMRFRSPDRAIAAARFFGPRFGSAAVIERARILNRIVTQEEAFAGILAIDALLDKRVTVVDPAGTARRIEQITATAQTWAERLAYAARWHAEYHDLDLPEVEDFPIAMDEEDADLTRLAFMLRWRAVRALARWLGINRRHTIDDLLRRFLAHPAPAAPDLAVTSR